MGFADPDAARGDTLQIISKQRFEAHKFFAPIQVSGEAEFVSRANAFESDAHIDRHPFFSFAPTHPDALVLWASQEAVVTNPFSQLLLRVISQIDNAHVRSLLMPVVSGEHSGVKGGIAEDSHPWLIWRLCRSIGLTEQSITVSTAVADFIARLEETTGDTMRALGALGVGNERMLLSEYRAVQHCFDIALPQAEYGAFLQANITEDQMHTNLISLAACGLAAFGHDPEQYVRGAREGVAARVRYYDMLLAEAQGS